MEDIRKMKLLFIRHGDPDYTIDSLTEKGWKEAEFLSEKMLLLMSGIFMSRHLEEQRIPHPAHLRKTEEQPQNASGSENLM